MPPSLKKPKPIKRKVFEKDTDDRYVVVCRPFRQGRTGSWTEFDTYIVARWLRRALRSKKQCVYAVYTLSSREEIIVKIAADEDISKILGKHQWMGFLQPDYAKMVVEKHDKSLGDRASDIFEYDFKFNGDPGSKDASYPRKEWLVLDDSPANNLSILTDGYPNPTWVQVPYTDPRLISLVLPIPHPHGPDDALIVPDDEPPRQSQNPNRSKSDVVKQERLEQKPNICKRENVDLCGDDFRARSTLDQVNIKGEADEDLKPKAEDLMEAPPSLVDALNGLKSRPESNAAPLKTKSEDQKSILTSEEGDRKPPPQSLLKALAALQPQSGKRRTSESIIDNRSEQKIKRETGDSAESREPGMRHFKRPKREMNN